MTAKEVYEASKEWDLTSHAACHAFSDWLLEHDEVKWANLVRWASHCMYVNANHQWNFWREEFKMDIKFWLSLQSEETQYKNWRDFSFKEGFTEEIPPL